MYRSFEEEAFYSHIHRNWVFPKQNPKLKSYKLQCLVLTIVVSDFCELTDVNQIIYNIQSMAAFVSSSLQYYYIKDTTRLDAAK